jgi:hypothetical protein
MRHASALRAAVHARGGEGPSLTALQVQQVQQAQRIRHADSTLPAARDHGNQPLNAWGKRATV